MITILGAGLLGSGFARALRRKGHDVRVWNRTPAKAQALAADGIVVATDPAEAVRGAERVHIVVSDDAAVDSVLAAAAPGLASGALVFDHSTTSPGGALARTNSWRERGITFVHAPVFMGPQNALESTGIMLISGDRAIVQRVSPMLAPMTGKLVDLGPRIEQAASFKLLGNLILMAFTAGFTDFLALAKALGVTPAEAGTLFDHFNPGPSLAARYRRMTEAAYDQPSWELAMARKDARLMQEEAARANLPLIMVPALAQLMDQMIERGLAHADWTVVGKDLVV
ncbi:MAG TPA: NAD(P)-dependent oxidoreductase [Kofleriaceae bacterium]|nr:NAD(P)-dependent oxidoreductase [Kofleriaceae bacterium]